MARLGVDDGSWNWNRLIVFMLLITFFFMLRRPPATALSPRRSGPGRDAGKVLPDVTPAEVAFTTPEPESGTANAPLGAPSSAPTPIPPSTSPPPNPSPASAPSAAVGR
jgi:hypothetical protein